MTRVLNLALRAGCLLAFAAALARLAGWLPPTVFPYATWIAAGLLAAHAVECVFFMKYLRLYRGPLALSVVLTLLFGLLHWKPLADQQARRSR